MKRSEAYSRLQANIKLRAEVHDAAMLFQQGSIFWGKLCEIIAEEALSVVEDFGMLPPLNENNYHYMDNDDRRVVNQAKVYFTWEPEDEKK